MSLQNTMQAFGLDIYGRKLTLRY